MENFQDELSDTGDLGFLVSKSLQSPLSPTVLLRQLYEQVEEFAILTVDTESNITSWNAGASKIFGYGCAEALGQSSAMLFTAPDIDEGQPFAEMQIAAQHGKAADYRWHKRKDGSIFWADGVQMPIHADSTGQLIGFIKITRDITGRKEEHDRIEKLATTDSLTNLHNRTSFDSRRNDLTDMATRMGRKLLLFMIDLDRFKEINDTYGHNAGDELLAQAGARIKAVSRSTDVVARIGGDEFALLQVDPPTTLMGAVLASKILDALSTPFKLESVDITVSGSVGIAVFPDDASLPDNLLKSADLALYEAKSSGRNCYRYFTRNLDEIAHRRYLEQSELKHLERTCQFYLVYQPIIDTNTGVALKVEALLRFPGVVLTANSVDYVIDLAKEIGLITKIGIWVFSEACAQLREWRDAGLTSIRVAVNTCAKELLEAEYLPNILEVLRAKGLRPQDIELEITERDAIEMGQRSATVLQQLNEIGFSIVLDDFGTGYSSLSYLRNLPVSGIKLDKSFLKDVPAENDANAVTRAVICLAQELRLSVTAEGVEHVSQQEFLCDAGCHAFQGYLLAPPMASREAFQWLTSGPGQGSSGGHC